MRLLLAAAVAVTALAGTAPAGAEDCGTGTPRNPVVSAGLCGDGGCTDLCYIDMWTYCESNLTAVDKACGPLRQEIA